MPGKDQMDPNSRNSRILAWYREHPGYHRCVSVAQALGMATHDVAASSWALNQRGMLDRQRLTVGGTRKTPVTHYGIAAAYTPPPQRSRQEEDREEVPA